jgi:hypothetical protein
LKGGYDSLLAVLQLDSSPPTSVLEALKTLRDDMIGLSTPEAIALSADFVKKLKILYLSKIK